MSSPPPYFTQGWAHLVPESVLPLSPPQPPSTEHTQDPGLEATTSPLAGVTMVASSLSHKSFLLSFTSRPIEPPSLCITNLMCGSSQSILPSSPYILLFHLDFRKRLSQQIEQLKQWVRRIKEVKTLGFLWFLSCGYFLNGTGS